MINLSLGGMRDPGDRSMDEFSPVEAAAIHYAVRHGRRRGRGRRQLAVALPLRELARGAAARDRRLGLGPDGRTPPFSQPRRRFNDLAAPGRRHHHDGSRCGRLDAASPSTRRRATDRRRTAPSRARRSPRRTSAPPPRCCSRCTPSSRRPGHDAARGDRDRHRAAVGSPATREGRDALTGFGLLDIYGGAQLARDPLDWPPARHATSRTTPSRGAEPVAARGSKVGGHDRPSATTRSTRTTSTCARARR